MTSGRRRFVSQILNQEAQALRLRGVSLADIEAAFISLVREAIEPIRRVERLVAEPED